MMLKFWVWDWISTIFILCGGDVKSYQKHKYFDKQRFSFKLIDVVLYDVWCFLFKHNDTYDLRIQWEELEEQQQPEHIIFV